MTVYDLKMGESAKIARIDLDGGARARLKALGFFEGARVTVLGYSLFKSSVLLGCGAVRLGIRRGLAEKIQVGRG